MPATVDHHRGCAVATQILLAALLLLLGGCASVERLAIPDKILLSTNFAQSGTEDSVSHATLSRFLGLYTRKDDQGVVRLDYASVSTAEHRQLKAYIAGLVKVDTRVLTRNAQLAYWANLYNAVTADVVLDHYPVESIRNIKDGAFDLGPWEEKRLMLHGRPTSLHDIEHGIVRALWRDTPEIHYILNCASIGCPNLPQSAYSGDSIQRVMQEAAMAFVNDPHRGVSIDNNRLRISKIYSWYRPDFGGSDESILEHLRRYAKPDLSAQLTQCHSVNGYFYDWSLNDTGA
ncbi:MAG: DUF547 domain-containing protein [Congregibacter sp.]|nr:DUF547 domain-containing protein [Congregibacter sp.]